MARLSFAAILSDTFLQSRSSSCTDVHRAIQSEKKKRREKKNTLRKGKKRGKRKHFHPDVRTHSRVTSTLSFHGAQMRTISIHSLSISFSLIGTSIALSHASQQMHLIKHILFFMYKRETALLLK